MLGNSKWIWQETSESKDVYVEFYSTFVCEGGNTEINISADSDYTLFINGKYASSEDLRVFKALSERYLTFILFNPRCNTR